MSRLSSYLRTLRAKKVRRSIALFQTPAPSQGTDEIIISGQPPRRMATFAADKIIGASIRQTGKFQEDAILKVIDFIGHNADKCPVFLDIGANIGTHSIFALHNGFSKAICVEPEPNNFMLLRVNQILNSVEDRCANVQAAISFENSTVKMELCDTNYGDHRILASDAAEGNAFNESARQTIDIQTMTLDGLLAHCAVDPKDIGLIWIDTQGHEGHVLSKADLVEKANVPVVLEFWPYGLQRSSGYPLLRQFLQRHARIYDLSKTLAGQRRLSIKTIDRLYEANAYGDKAAYWHTDFLVMPN